MDTSRRAVESYWRSRLIDGVTSPEDKVAPVYKLEEVCDLLRSSHVGIVKEVSELTLTRLDHKSPVVKQKALRVIKYCVGKSGVEFRREMQRHSAAIRQLSHYKGQPDQLKGDSLNKAVRDTASEALTAIFASDEGRPSSSAEVVNKRIQGFGSTNYEMPLENKKSFLSEVVNLSNASIRQGLSTIASAHSLNKNDNGSYKSPNLRRSLTREADRGYDREVDTRETWNSIGDSRSSMVGATNNLESRSSTPETNGDTGPSHTVGKSREERLLDTIVTSGGVRLQPTRDTLQMFLTEAMKVDAVALLQALEAKLQSPLWQLPSEALPESSLEGRLYLGPSAHGGGHGRPGLGWPWTSWPCGMSGQDLAAHGGGWPRTSSSPMPMEVAKSWPPVHPPWAPFHIHGWLALAALPPPWTIR